MSEKTFQERWRGHKNAAKCGSKQAVHRAMRKYGNPVIQILGDGLSREEACALEVEAINLFQTKVPVGYNMTEGGEGSNGWYDLQPEHRKEEIQKASSARMSRLIAEGRLDHTAGVAALRTPEGRAAAGERVKRRMETDPVFREKALAALAGAKNSEVRRKNFEAGIVKRSNDPRWLEAQRERVRKMQADSELQARMAIDLAKRNADPEFQARRLEKVREALAKPEVRAATAERNKARAKIKPEQYPEVLQMLKSIGYTETAKQLGVCKATLGNIKQKCEATQ